VQLARRWSSSAFDTCRGWYLLKKGLRSPMSCNLRYLWERREEKKGRGLVGGLRCLAVMTLRPSVNHD